MDSTDSTAGISRIGSAVIIVNLFMLWVYWRQIAVHGDDPGKDYLIRFYELYQHDAMKSKIYCLVGADIISRISLRRHGLDVDTVDRIAGREFIALAFKGGDVFIRETDHHVTGMKPVETRTTEHWLPLDAVTIL